MNRDLNSWWLALNHEYFPTLEYLNHLVLFPYKYQKILKYVILFIRGNDVKTMLIILPYEATNKRIIFSLNIFQLFEKKYV